MLPLLSAPPGTRPVWGHPERGEAPASNLAAPPQGVSPAGRWASRGGNRGLCKAHSHPSPSPAPITGEDRRTECHGEFIEPSRSPPADRRFPSRSLTVTRAPQLPPLPPGAALSRRASSRRQQGQEGGEAGGEGVRRAGWGGGQGLGAPRGLQGERDPRAASAQRLPSPRSLWEPGRRSEGEKGGASHPVVVLSAGRRGPEGAGRRRAAQLCGSSGASPPSSPALSAVQSVRLSRSSCMMRVLSL